jgi:hypothetical protein
MNRYAYLIGRNGPQSNKMDTLKFAESDAERMAKTLRGESSMFATTLADQKKDASSCLAEMEQLAANCGHDDVLLFYFSGHGHNPRGELFLLFPNSDLRRLVTTALPINSVKAIMSASKARVRILVLDCCHSGAAGRETLKTSQRPQELPLVEAARDSASIIIAACGRNVVTRERPEFEGGFLTHLLCQALEGKSEEADIDQDGLLSVTDFIQWAGDFTRSHNAEHQHKVELQMETPEIYGDFRSQVYLTANRFVVRDDELTKELLTSVEPIRSEFAKHRRMKRPRLQTLARPIKSIAATFTKLDVLDALFEKNDDAAIFAAATILQIRRDPRYMSRLVRYVNDDRLRGAANWRVLRAIRDTIARYEFSAIGRRDFIARLREAAKQRDTKKGRKFAKGTSLSMIYQIMQRLSISPEEVFTSIQLQELRKKSPRRQKVLPS